MREAFRSTSFRLRRDWILWAVVGVLLGTAPAASWGIVSTSNASKQIGVTEVRPERSQHPEYLVGVNYFAGWWPEEPNKYIPHGRDWRLDFPERIPLLGEYNDQDTMDREIIAASEHGVDFFQILWYYQDPEHERHFRQERLNDGVRMFMDSRESSRMRFVLEITNHPPFLIDCEDEWERSCREWCEVM